jgi:ribonuclease P protein component
MVKRVQRELRLSRREDFNKVYKYGKSEANRQFVIYRLHNPNTERFRMGVSVSKKLGNAVIRNRLRRMIKEMVRIHAEQICRHYDFIVIARKPIVDMEYQEMEKCLLHVLKKAELLQSSSCR